MKQRGLSRGRRKAPSLSFASLAGLWRAGLAVQAVAAQSIARSDQQQPQQQQPLARRDQAAVAAAGVGVRCPEQQRPVCSGGEGQGPGAVDGCQEAVVECGAGAVDVAVGVGWPEETAEETETAGWSGERAAGRSREDGVRPCGCGQPAACSEGGGRCAEETCNGCSSSGSSGCGYDRDSSSSRRNRLSGDEKGNDGIVDGGKRGGNSNSNSDSDRKTEVDAVAPAAATLTCRPAGQRDENRSCNSSGGGGGGCSGSDKRSDDGSGSICEPRQSGECSSDDPIGAATSSASAPAPTLASPSPSPSPSPDGGDYLQRAPGSLNNNAGHLPAEGNRDALSAEPFVLGADSPVDAAVGTVHGQEKEGRGVGVRKVEWRRRGGGYCDEQGGGARYRGDGTPIGGVGPPTKRERGEKNCTAAGRRTATETGAWAGTAKESR